MNLSCFELGDNYIGDASIFMTTFINLWMMKEVLSSLFDVLITISDFIEVKCHDVKENLFIKFNGKNNIIHVLFFCFNTVETIVNWRPKSTRLLKRSSRKQALVG